MKTFTFHMDMIITIAILIGLTIGANVYQWQIHAELSKEYLSTKLELTGKQVELINTEAGLKECLENSTSAKAFTVPAD